jgi:hemoglobin
VESASSGEKSLSDEKEVSSYEAIGGEGKLKAIVDRFYEIMAQKPEYRGIRDMHPQDLSGSNEKLFMFLSGWLGGPNLFVEKHGHPRLRARHFPFAIGKSERDQWVLCMVEAFDAEQVQEPLRSDLLHSLLRLADHMRNKTEEAE